MTTTTRPRTDEPPSQRPQGRPRRRWGAPLGHRLHFYAGILVGPFIFIAAITGALYALTPQIERVVYADQLTAPISGGPQLPLSDQVRVANEYLDGEPVALTAVRPAPEPGATTRVMYAEDGLAASESRAVFVDPGTGQIRGDLTVYGTSGALPMRTWVDNLHRSLHLGDAGRLYSELAASWLGAVVLAGVGLWVARWRTTRHRTELLRPAPRRRGHRRLMSWHASTGIWIAVAALFLSATGITWSQHAGANVSELRAALNVATPALNTSLTGGGTDPADEHPHHGDHAAGTAAEQVAPVDATLFDDVLAIGQTVNINTGLVEIKPPSDPGSAWTVQEIQRSYPTEVDGVAIDPTTMSVVDRVDFADYTLIAKLARWGIDTHMGSMFGLPNQIILFLVATGIATMVVLGYRMWWKRRPTRGFGNPPPRGVVNAAPWWGRTLIIAGGVLIGLWLPLLGYTLAAFVLIDLVWSRVSGGQLSTRGT